MENFFFYSLVPYGASEDRIVLSFLHCTMPGTPWKENSAISLERVATVQLCGLRKKLVACFCHFLKLHLSAILKLMGRHTNMPVYKNLCIKLQT